MSSQKTKEYIRMYSRHGKHKCVGKFKSWYNALQWIKTRFNDTEPDDPRLKDYYLKRTKS